MLTPTPLTSHPIDVVVAGGGCAGVVAAVAAARNKAGVLLLERNGYLGGTSTSVLDSFYGFFTPGDARQTVFGIPIEVIDTLNRSGHVIYRRDEHGGGTGVGYDPERLKLVWDELVAKSGASLLLRASVVNAELSDDGTRPHRLIIESIGGLYTVACHLLIDATGDATVCSRGGAPFLPRSDAVEHQCLTTTVRLANVDTKLARSFSLAKMRDLINTARQDGYELPHDDIHVHRMTFPGGALGLMTRIPIASLTDPWEVSHAEVSGRHQAVEYVRFLRDRVPGYERSALIGFSPAIGIRESRRILGAYILTREDLESGRSFDDVVGRSGSPMELQHAAGSTWAPLAPGTVYDIPLRSLIIKGFTNVLVAGRCISASEEAHSSVRLMGQCMAMGEGAGTAAAMAVHDEANVSELSAAKLRRRLSASGALIDRNVLPYFDQALTERT